ncbi:hypothetical protein BH11BAC2_BH11BAC2_08810 [soil metagenome]
MNRKNCLRISLIILISLCWLPGKSQNKILLINGKVIEAETYSIGDLFVTYKKAGDSRSTPRAVDRYDVFSVIRRDSTEEIVYTPDSLDFTLEEARSYIKGEQIALAYYRRPSTSISSAILGAGSSILSFYALPVPFLYGVILSRFNPKPSKFQLPENMDRAIVNDEPFKLGYQKAARNLKIQKSLKWGYIGLGVGLTTLIIYGANH